MKPISLALLVAAAQLLLIACEDHPDVTAPPDSTLAVERTTEIPEGWSGGTESPASFVIGTDRTNQRSGSAAAYLASVTDTPSTFANIMQSIRAADYRGRRVRWSGWVRPNSVGGEGAGLWMRVDGPGVMQAFDNMQGARAILGTADWSRVSVVLDVPANAIGIAFGALLAGPGTLLVDDLRLEAVGADVPSTNQLAEPTPMGYDSAAVAATYQRTPRAPLNLDFEGLPEPDAATVAWLAHHAVPFTSVQSGTDLTDLAALKDMVGGARVVALGEGTHGTREFFQMKHRVLEYLVRELGFTQFAMEASSTEADVINTYVLGGSGPYRTPEQLVATLHFWTWDTQEVVDLLRWMREWNAAAPPDRQVQFQGFDMQYMGGAIDVVQGYIVAADPANYSFVSNHYQCLVPYRNYLLVQGKPATVYAALPDSVRTACRSALQAVFDLIDQHRAEYQAASGAAYDQALHSARLVVQWEANAASSGAPATASRLRDRYMAENVQWLLNQAAPGTRMMLWAHNTHVSRIEGQMGYYLATALGPDYVNLGFLFGTGAFNAIGDRGFTKYQATLVPNNSLEAAFTRTGLQRLLLDARLMPQGADSAAALRGPIPMRSVGALFYSDKQAQFFYAALLPGDFDLLIFIDQTTPSTILPSAVTQGYVP
jgi:erythromycin esterase